MGLRDISHPACFHTHRTHPTNKGRQQLDRWRDRRLLRVGTSRSPSQRVCRYGVANSVSRPASVRLFCGRLHRGHTTCLHLAALVDLLAHATVLLALLRKCHQARRIGSLYVRKPLERLTLCFKVGCDMTGNLFQNSFRTRRQAF